MSLSCRVVWTDRTLRTGEHKSARAASTSLWLRASYLWSFGSPVPSSGTTDTLKSQRARNITSRMETPCIARSVRDGKPLDAARLGKLVLGATNGNDQGGPVCSAYTCEDEERGLMSETVRLQLIWMQKRSELDGACVPHSVFYKLIDLVRLVSYLRFRLRNYEA